MPADKRLSYRRGRQDLNGQEINKSLLKSRLRRKSCHPTIMRGNKETASRQPIISSVWATGLELARNHPIDPKPHVVPLRGPILKKREGSRSASPLDLEGGDFLSMVIYICISPQYLRIFILSSWGISLKRQ